MAKFFFTTIILFCFTSLHPNNRTIEISVKPVFKERGIILETEKYTSDLGDTLTIDVFRFYISDIKIKLSNGKSYQENNSYHLIDIEDPSTLKIILNDLPEGKIQNLTFNIGVDSLMSVSGAMEGDLDPTKGMYWAWNSGYINAKLEGKSTKCQTHHNRFEFHIGGYSFPNKAIRNVSLDVSKGVEAKITLIADASYWLNGVQLATVNSIVMPGTKAMKMADSYSKMFRIDE